MHQWMEERSRQLREFFGVADEVLRHRLQRATGFLLRSQDGKQFGLDTPGLLYRLGAGFYLK